MKKIAINRPIFLLPTLIVFRIALSTFLQSFPVIVYIAITKPSTCGLYRYCRAIRLGFCVIEHRPFVISHGANLLETQQQRDSCKISVNVAFANFTDGVFIETWTG